MNLNELKKQTVISQMSYYLTLYAQEAVESEHLTYHPQDNVVFFANDRDLERYKDYGYDVFSVSLKEIKFDGGIEGIYFSNKNFDKFQVVDIKSIIHTIEEKYEERNVR